MNKINSVNCKERLSVRLLNGDLVWIYDYSLYTSYVEGNNEIGETVYYPFSNISSMIEVECNNSNNIYK